MKMGALSGLRILDLSRVLAGPVCTQMLGDLGAEIIKIEKPGAGDDTRSWGPPFLRNAQGKETTESAYYLSANRNKKSVAIDLAKPEGQSLIFKLLAHCDVLIENFKVDGLHKYGLAYEQVSEKFPRLIYASISGFGQLGPLAHEPGYDFLAQGMGGLMAATGAADQPPTKAGVAVSDYVAGLNITIGILAALVHRQQSGLGQRVDVSLLSSTIAMMTNIAQYTLTSGENAPRVGNAHSTIVPYQSFETADGHINIAVGNDHQFRIFANCCEHPGWADDPRFATNTARVKHRIDLVPLIAAVIKTRPLENWLKILREADVPCGPILSMKDVFVQDQVRAIGMVTTLAHPVTPEPISLVANALNFSRTPPAYTLPPPLRAAHTRTVLTDLLGLDSDTLSALVAAQVIEI